MNLELEAFIAVVRVQLAHNQIELTQYQKVLSFATPDMEAFEILLKRVEELISDKIFLENKLKEI